MGKVTVENGKISYRKFMKRCELEISNLVWAYLQQEDVSAKMCCGSYNTEIGRVIVVDKDGKKEVFQFESMQEARELLAKLQQANAGMAVGYTAENKKKFNVQ